MANLTVKQVAERLSISDQAVRDLIKRGDLRAFRFGGSIRVEEKDFERFREDSLIRPSSSRRKPPRVAATRLKEASADLYEFIRPEDLA